MSDPMLSGDKGEALSVTFTYEVDLTDKVATFVVRERPGDPDPSLLTLSSEDVSPTAGLVSVDLPGKTVAVNIYGPTTLALPGASAWTMWINPDGDDAIAVTGSLRLRETVRP